MIGDRLKQLRKSKKLTQQELAKLINTSSGYISEIENGKKVPGGEFLLSLKRFFGVSVDWLLSGEEDQQFEQTKIEPTIENNRNVIDLQHKDLVGKFLDKPRAKNANIDLLEIEQLDRETFIEVVGYIKGVAAGLRKSAPGGAKGIERRESERRLSSDPSMAPDGQERRSGADRRKVSGGHR